MRPSIILHTTTKRIIVPDPGPQSFRKRRFWRPSSSFGLRSSFSYGARNELENENEQALWCSLPGARTVVLVLERALPGTPPRGGGGFI